MSAGDAARLLTLAALWGANFPPVPAQAGPASSDQRS
ncbi:MAG: hypothetical protein JWL78_1365 [Chloroflexi bacterium]|jgi:hypothetical protein|nr:hypothetical protein [Chloroflexota bacterium]